MKPKLMSGMVVRHSGDKEHSMLGPGKILEVVREEDKPPKSRIAFLYAWPEAWVEHRYLRTVQLTPKVQRLINELTNNRED